MRSTSTDRARVRGPTSTTDTMPRPSMGGGGGIFTEHGRLVDPPLGF